MSQLITDILKNNDFRYLMYRGGAGGEFITYTISKYSDDYEPLDVTEYAYNRWNLEVPAIINAIALSRVKELPESALVHQISTLLSQKGREIDSAIVELDNYLRGKKKKHLFRAHISLNDYFNENNTYLLTIDSQHWFDYCNWLQYIKVGSTLITIDTPEFHSTFYDLDHLNGRQSNNPLLVKAGNLIKEGAVPGVTYAHLDILHAHDVNELGVNELNLKTFLNKPLVDIKDEFYSFFFPRLSGSLYEKYQNEVLPKRKLIFYSRLFEPGYINSMFNINSDGFDSEVQIWHQSNLKILKDMSFDISDYE